MQIFLLLPLGAALGVLASFPVARALQIRLGEADLQQYAQRILHVEELTAQETARAADTIAGDKLAFCSDADIAAMRDFVFKAAFVRDIGRVKDGSLYCTSIQGRLPQPVAVAAADLTVGHEQIRRNLPVSLISPDSEGIIVYDRGISVVLNRSAVESLDNGSRLSTGLIYDRAHGRVLPLYGHDTPLSGAEILAQRLMVRGDTAYVPACSATEAVCVVAAEPLRAMLQRNRTDFAGFLIDGMLLGSTVMAIVLLFIFRQRSLERRLRRAIGRSQITCVYQPIVDLTTAHA